MTPERKGWDTIRITPLDVCRAVGEVVVGFFVRNHEEPDNSPLNEPVFICTDIPGQLSLFLLPEDGATEPSQDIYGL